MKKIKVLFLLATVCLGISISLKVVHAASDPVKPNVIDISKWQDPKNIDFKKWKEQGIEAVIIKLTEGMEDDQPVLNPQAEEQIKGALEAGIRVNFYHYSWMNSIQNAREEADWFAKIANNLNVPKDSVMALDLEGNALTKDRQELTDQANAFFDRMREHGYQKLDVYASLSWYQNRFYPDQLSISNFWLAYWPETPIEPPFPVGLWQFASDYRLDGYDGLLDANIDYTGFYTGKKIEIPDNLEEQKVLAAIKALFQNQNENGTLLEDTDQAKIDNVSQLLSSLKESDQKQAFQKLLDEAQRQLKERNADMENQLAAEKAIKNLFEGQQLGGSIKENVNKELIDHVQYLISQMNDSPQKTEFQQALNLAKQQVLEKERQRITEDAIKNLFEGQQLGGKVKDTVSSDMIDQVQLLVNEITDTKQKERLQQLLNEASRQLDNRKEKEKAPAVSEENKNLHNSAQTSATELSHPPKKVNPQTMSNNVNKGTSANSISPVKYDDAINKIPQTGDENNQFILLLGSILTIFGGILFRKSIQ
ncbi:GH25 family lysozyme [Listeria grandensis]|uniref:GH25 family lysozyme n=1 Tax=Listeria grandensis TaxID=1494963 RepID=UPI00164DC45E|nr:GH25 family lysozyme [Listeria grandensis]MBC6314457.1 LPXTG cell wall anchor domain-containing protein [Listeria grandensis]